MRLATGRLLSFNPASECILRFSRAVTSFRDRVSASGQKKLLALDGGGIRGVITLEVLARIEEELRVKTRRGSEFVLADYFDYIGGTSTGAIIASCLALGMSVAEVQRFYFESGPKMFSRAALLRRFRYKFEDEKLAERLRAVFGEDTTLGSDRLRTLLMLVLRNATTDSPWPVSNNPRAAYNQGIPSNLDLPLWQLVRASTAAPVYFPPEVVRIADRRGNVKEYLFVDGGVTMYNNPAFQLFLMATVQAYNLCWRAGVEDMLLVSVGTGTSAEANANLRPEDMNLLYNAASIPSALMYAALNEQDFLCRVFGECRHGHALDREVGDLVGCAGPVSPKLFAYVRYNAELSREGLEAMGLSDIVPEHVQSLDSVDHLAELRAVGKALAARVQPAHFAGF